MDISSYFSISAWFDYFFGSSSASELEDEPLFLDYDSEISLETQPLDKDHIARLDSGQKLSYFKEAKAQCEARLDQLHSEKLALETHRQVIDKSLSELYGRRDKWEARRKQLPNVLHTKSPQRVLAEKKLQEFDGAIAHMQREKAENERLFQITCAHIHKAQVLHEKLKAKIALMQ